MCAAFLVLRSRRSLVMDGDYNCIRNEWMNLLAERAQVPPISVHVGVQTPELCELKSLLKNAREVQITKLRERDSLQGSTIELPEVRSLRVHVTDAIKGGYAIATPPDFSWITFQPVGDMPHLADLHLYGVLDFHLINPCITGNLTSLFIGSRHDNPLRRNIKDVLNVLSRTPLLERFTLAHCNFHADVVGAIIHVPALRYLGLEAETLMDVACIFNSLVLSPGARVHLAAEIPYGGSDLEVWDILGRALSQSTWADLHTWELLSLPEVEPEIILRVSPEDEDSFAISAWRDDEPGYACLTGQPAGERRIQVRLGITQELRPEPDFCLRLRGYFGGSSRDNVLPRVIALFSVASDLRTLSLRPDRMVDSKLSWLDIFMQYPLLTGIRVDNEKDLDRLFAALCFNDQPLPVRELETISFPRSRRLASCWSASIDWKHPSNKNKKKRGERGRLLAGLMQRRESAGAPFANIYLRRSQLQGEELWDSLTRGSVGRPDFVQQARQIIKPMELWNWEDWGIGL